MSNSKILVVCVPLAILSVVRADAVLELTPLTPTNGPGGVGYLPGSVVDFQVGVTQDRPMNTPIRGLRLDFTASDPALIFLGPDNFPVGSPDGVPEFVFDFSTASTSAMYNMYSGYSVPRIEYAGVGYVPGFMLEVPASGAGSLILGTGQVELPMVSGTYILDVLNAATADPESEAAQIRFGFGGPDPVTVWSAVPGLEDGLIHGDPLELTVVALPCPGDFNRDMRRDLLDFAVLQRNFEQAGSSPEEGDADGNGTVDLQDFAIFVNNIGAICLQ